MCQSKEKAEKKKLEGGEREGEEKSREESAKFGAWNADTRVTILNSTLTPLKNPGFPPHYQMWKSRIGNATHASNWELGAEKMDREIVVQFFAARSRGSSVCDAQTTVFSI